MSLISAHYENGVFVPDQPVHLKNGDAVTIIAPESGALPLGPPSSPLTDAVLAERLKAVHRLREMMASVPPIPVETLRRENLYGDDGKLQ